jgi:hypothetical protein
MGAKRQGAGDLRAGPSREGLAGCLALLELEAQALGYPLAARLIAAAGEDLREPPEALRGPGQCRPASDQA